MQEAQDADRVAIPFSAEAMVALSTAGKNSNILTSADARVLRNALSEYVRKQYDTCDCHSATSPTFLVSLWHCQRSRELDQASRMLQSR